jgi:hypothetical protein
MRTRTGTPWLPALVTALALLAGAASEAPGAHNAFEQVSVGVTGGNGALPTQFVGASADGTRIFLRTEEALAASDTDANFDVYENVSGAVSHVSIGPAGGNGDFDVSLRGLSADGTRAFVETSEPLVAADTDDCEPADPEPNGCVDVYEHSGGDTTLISTGTEDTSSRFEGVSQDGGTVFFKTKGRLVASDTDDQADLYERSGSTTRLISTGSSGGNGSFPAFFRGASADGARVFFTTAERLAPGDTDSSADVYERAGGATTLVSTGPAGGNGAFDAAYHGSTPGGAQIFIQTRERLTPADTDSAVDVYERTGGTTTLVSTGPTGGNGAFDAHFRKPSDGGSRLFFDTAERLTSFDTDTAVDVYERAGGTTTLVSTGPAGGNGAFDALLQDVSSDGGTVVIGTAERLTTADTDNRFDIYSRNADATTLLTTAPGGGNGDFDAFFDGMSRDGRRVFFETLEQLSDDTDAYPDVYERANGATTKISDGPNGGNGANIAVFVGTTDDGARVFFSTLEKIASTDTDNNVDVHVARISAGYARPKGATPLYVPLVPAYRPCTSPNRAHGPPALGGGAFDPSCSPPVQASDHLTVGTGDSNGRATTSMGSVKYATVAGDPDTLADEADVRLRVSLDDVRRKSNLQDYTGELQVDASVRVTDKYNGSSPVDPATVSDLPFPFAVPCATTDETTTGSVCSIDTTADAVVPGAIKEGARAIWQLAEIEVFDGGADGRAATPPNTLFARQGVFIP